MCSGVLVLTIFLSHALGMYTCVMHVPSAHYTTSFRHENETLAEKYKNAQASLNSTLSLKARLVHWLM